MRGGRRGVLRERGQHPRVPGEPHERGQRIALLLDAPEHGGELRFEREQPLVSNTGINFDLFIAEGFTRPAWGFFLLGDRIPHRPDHPFAR
jgi:hypothetical protein